MRLRTETQTAVESLQTQPQRRPYEWGVPVTERQRVTNGTGPEAWLESTASYDAWGRIVWAKGPAETVNSTQVSWDYSDDNTGDNLDLVTVTNQAQWVTKQWSESAFGNVVKTQDANGGFTHYKYDAGGLLVAGWANRDDVYGAALSIRTTPVAVVSAQFAGLTAAGAPL